jgi:hypothetical protein
MALSGQSRPFQSRYSVQFSMFHAAGSMHVAMSHKQLARRETRHYCEKTEKNLRPVKRPMAFLG